MNIKCPQNCHLKKKDGEIDLNHCNLKNKKNTQKELDPLSTAVEMGAKNRGTLILVHILILTSCMPLGKSQKLFQPLACQKDTTICPI